VASDILHPNMLAVTFQNVSGTTVIDSLPWQNKTLLRYHQFAHKLRNGTWLIFLRDFIYCLNKEHRLLWTRPYPRKPISMLENRDGAILIGLPENKGLEKYRSLDDLRMGKIEATCLTDLSVSAMLQDREGGFWIGTLQEGIFYCPSWDGGTIAKTPLLDGQIVKSIVASDKNHLYAGLMNGRVFEISLKDKQIQDISPANSTYLVRLSLDKRSQTLGMAGSPANFYQNGHWGNAEIFDPTTGKKGSGGGFTYKSPGNAAEIWFGADMVGLWKVDFEKKVVADATRNGFKKDVRFYSIRQAPDSRVWASRHDGLVEWLGDSVLRRPEIEHPAFLQTSPDIQYLSDGSLVLCPKGFGVVI